MKENPDAQNEGYISESYSDTEHRDHALLLNTPSVQAAPDEEKQVIATDGTTSYSSISSETQQIAPTRYRDTSDGGSFKRSITIPLSTLVTFAKTVFPEAAYDAVIKWAELQQTKCDTAGLPRIKSREFTLHDTKKLISQEGGIYNRALAVLQTNLEISSKNSALPPSANTVCALIKVAFSIQGQEEPFNAIINITKTVDGVERANITSPLTRRSVYQGQDISTQFINDSRQYLGYDFERTGTGIYDIGRYYGHSEQVLSHDILMHKESIAEEIVSLFNKFSAFSEKVIEEINIQLLMHSLNEVCTSCHHFLIDTLDILTAEVNKHATSINNIPVRSEALSTHYNSYIIPSNADKEKGDKIIGPLLSLLRLVYENDAEDYKEYVLSLLNTQQKIEMNSALEQTPLLYHDLDNLISKLPCEIGADFRKSIEDARTYIVYLGEALEAPYLAMNNDNDFIAYMAYYLGLAARMPNIADKKISFKIPQNVGGSAIPLQQMNAILNEVISLLHSQDRDKAMRYVKNFHNDMVLDPDTIKTFDWSSSQNISADPHIQREHNALKMAVENGTYAYSGMFCKEQRQEKRKLESLNGYTPEKSLPGTTVQSKITPGSTQRLNGPRIDGPIPMSTEYTELVANSGNNTKQNNVPGSAQSKDDADEKGDPNSSTCSALGMIGVMSGNGDAIQEEAEEYDDLNNSTYSALDMNGVMNGISDIEQEGEEELDDINRVFDMNSVMHGISDIEQDDPNNRSCSPHATLSVRQDNSSSVSEFKMFSPNSISTHHSAPPTGAREQKPPTLLDLPVLGLSSNLDALNLSQKESSGPTKHPLL